jgi:hypothetical protein
VGNYHYLILEVKNVVVGGGVKIQSITLVNLLVVWLKCDLPSSTFGERAVLLSDAKGMLWDRLQ